MENCVYLWKNPKQKCTSFILVKKVSKKEEKMIPEMPETNNGRP